MSNIDTTSTSLTATQIKENICNAKAQYVKVVYKSQKKPAAAFARTVLTVVSSGVFRAGVEFKNLSEVKEGIEQGKRGEVQKLPYGEWDVYPYTIKHNNQLQYRLYPTKNEQHKITKKYYVDGKQVPVSEFKNYLTPSAANKLEEDKLCFNVKEENILSTSEFEQYQLFVEDLS